MAKKKGPVSHIKNLLVGIFAGGNVVSLLMLYAVCGSTWVDPSLHPRVAVAGLFFPFILLFNIAFVPFWLIFKRQLVLIPIIGMLLCGGFIMDYYPVSFGGSGEKSDEDVTIISWNVQGFSYQTDSGWVGIKDYLAESGADIFCLVEAEASPFRKESLIKWADSVGFYYDIDNRHRNIFSRYPILSTEDVLMFTQKANGARNYRLLIGEDTVNVIIVHLESNMLTADEKEEYRGAIIDPHREEVESGGRLLLSKLSQSAAIRGPQTDSLANYLEQLKGQSVILCGDFNETPISYSYQKVSHYLKSAFRERGHGVGVSYNQPYFWVRIDHLFHSEDWGVISAKVDESTDASDHYPLVVTLKKQEK